MTRPIAALRSPMLMNILANVALWLKADIQPPENDVRYTPKSGHSETHAGLPLLTQLGH